MDRGKVPFLEACCGACKRSRRYSYRAPFSGSSPELITHNCGRSVVPSAIRVERLVKRRSTELLVVVRFEFEMPAYKLFLKIILTIKRVRE